MRSLSLYIKHQKNYFLFLIGIFVLPLGLFLEYSVYQLPKVQYVFLGVLIISQYVLFREKDFRRKIEGDVNEILKKELGRIPSRKEVYARTGQVIYYRGFTIVVAALSIFALMVYYNEY